MAVQTINNEADYEAALAEIARYFTDEPQLRTAEAARFDELAAQIEAYERRRWPIEDES